MLSVQVWPSLLIMGGLDPGLRVGGRCVHQTTFKVGTLMGVAREGANTAKVQWDDGDTSSRSVHQGYIRDVGGKRGGT